MDKHNKLPKKGVKCAYCGCETSIHTRVTFDMNYMSDLDKSKDIRTFCSIKHYLKYRKEVKNNG